MAHPKQVTVTDTTGCNLQKLKYSKDITKTTWYFQNTATMLPYSQTVKQSTHYPGYMNVLHHKGTFPVHMSAFEYRWSQLIFVDNS
jgi:hypothetical protein